MPTFHRFALHLALLSGLVLAGCSGTSSERLATLKDELGSGEPKKVTAAVIKLKSLLQEQPKMAAARLLLGQHLLSSGDAVSASIEFKRALELGQPSADVLPTLARAMLREGKAAQVLSQFQAEQLADPAAQADLMASVATAMAVLGNAAAATDLLAATLKAAPNAASALLARAQLQGSQGQFAEALVTLDALLKRAPGDAEAWALKGAVHSRRPGEVAAARMAFDNALKINPNDTNAMLSSIALSLSAGDLKTADQTFKALRQRAPNQVTTGLAEANIAYARGDHARAREIFQALLRALPENVSLLLGAGENELRLGSAQQAEAHFAKASALAPNLPLARQLLAQAQLKLGQAQRALVTLAPLISAPASPAEVLAIAAEAHLVDGDSKAAEAMYARIAKLKPTDPKLRTAIALANVGRTDDQQVAEALRTISETDTGIWADLALVNLHLQRGQASQALAALAEVERKRPDDPFTHHLRGQLLVMQGKLADGRASFEKALVLNTAYGPTVAALAALDMREGKADSAQKRFSDTIKAQPNNVAAMLGLAEIMARQGLAANKVKSQIDAAIKAAPQDAQARTALIVHHFDRSNFDAALNAARTAVAAIPENLDLLDMLARCQMRMQQTSQALSTYGKIASLAPRTARAHLGLAEIYLQTNELTAAERSISRSLELSPGLPEARAQAIMLAIKRQQFEQAVGIAKLMQKEQPDKAIGFLLEGEVDMRRARWSEAAVALRAATVKQAPGAASLKLYQVLRKDNQHAEADRFAARWMQQYPQDAAFLFMVAESVENGGDATKAEHLYRQVLALQANQVAALNNLAMLLARQKKPEAVALAERAVNLAPGQAVILDTLAFAQASIGKPAEAIEAQRQAVALAPTAPHFRLSLAKLLIQSKKPALAKAELVKILEQKPDQTDLSEVKALLAELR